jgi:protease secretion system outer membrane protein
MQPIYRRLLSCLLFAPVLHIAQAGPLSDAYTQAHGFDALFQQAGPEMDAGKAASQAAGAAYYPQFQASYSRLETEATPRQTYTITQPLISIDRYATLREATPRAILATASYQLREQELSQRLLKAVAELVRTTESQRLSKAKITALENQALSAQKSYAAGVGTITDQRDAQVRLDQARAEALMVDAQIDAARRQYTSITGQPVSAAMQSLPRTARAVRLLTVDDYLSTGTQGNPQLVAAQQNQRLADLAVTRTNGSLWPTLSAVYTASSVSNTSTSYTGLTLSLPLQPGTIYQMRGAVANASKQEQQTRETEQRTRLEVQRLWSLVNAGRAEIAIRMESIHSAALSVEANDKSFKGGVRSQIDVLNSIQTYYQVQQEYVNAVLTLSDNYLNLLLQAATPTSEAVVQVQTVLFPGL